MRGNLLIIVVPSILLKEPRAGLGRLTVSHLAVGWWLYYEIRRVTGETRE